MAEEEKTVTPSEMLSDALFRCKDFTHIIVVALNKENDLIIWRSTDTLMHAAGMLEAAKLQTLGALGEEDDLDEEEEEEDEKA